MPRGTQVKQQPQGRGRSGSRVEDHLELKTLERTLGEPTEVGIPEKENYGVSQRPPSPILVGLFLSISQPCGMIVQTANLVDT